MVRTLMETSGFFYFRHVPFYVYILYSTSTGSFYKGQTNDLKSRIDRHNAGYEQYTKSGIPWKLVWYCLKPSRKAAMQLEQKLKNLSVERLKAFVFKYSIEEKVTGLDVFDPWDQ